MTVQSLGTPQDTRGCSPDELRQLPGLHKAVGQVDILLPAVLSMQLVRGRWSKQL